MPRLRQALRVYMFMMQPLRLFIARNPPGLSTSFMPPTPTHWSPSINNQAIKGPGRQFTPKEIFQFVPLLLRFLLTFGSQYSSKLNTRIHQPRNLLQPDFANSDLPMIKLF